MNDSVMYREMAFFTLADTLGAVNDVKLKEVPLYYASEHGAGLNARAWSGDGRYLTFRFAEFDASKHTMTFDSAGDSAIIAIDSVPCWGVGKQPPQRQLSNMRLIIHSHYEIDIPQDAIAGIFEPPVYNCQTKEDRKREQHFFKYYISENGLYMYVYMLCGLGPNRYEVTWVFYASKYMGRFVHPVRG